MKVPLTLLNIDWCPATLSISSVPALLAGMLRGCSVIRKSYSIYSMSASGRKRSFTRYRAFQTFDVIIRILFKPFLAIRTTAIEDLLPGMLKREGRLR